ncbi:AlpA family transcriptional regulator [Marinobacter sp. RI1]|uniref:AlpA family transcriptional regulator n=1 Tax=Marinobacter sp. RI1 TaxID=3158171 RepID=UPI0034E896CE
MYASDKTRRIMRLPEVKAATGFGRAHIYNLMKEGRFPKARKIGARAVGWDSQQVESWVAAQLDGEA